MRLLYARDPRRTYTKYFRAGLYLCNHNPTSLVSNLSAFETNVASEEEEEKRRKKGEKRGTITLTAHQHVDTNDSNNRFTSLSLTLPHNFLGTFDPPSIRVFENFCW
jgi:hypothetical protein